MKRDADKNFETEPIFIGKIIEDELRRQERTVTWLSRKIHCDRRNVYDIFSRNNIDTELLYKLSVILNKDFFAYYSAKLQSADNEQITPPQQRMRRIENVKYHITLMRKTNSHNQHKG